MVEPPFVFVFSNEHLPYHLLSKDRWRCFEIEQNSKNLKLKNVNLFLRRVKNKTVLVAKKS